MATFASNRFYYWLIGGAFLLLVIFGIPWVLGYRIQGGHIASPGTAVITVPVSGSTIYIDGKQRGASTKDDQVLSFSVTSATHTILIGKNGYWPWKKELFVSSGKTLHLSPFMLSQTVTGTAITKNDPQYYQILGMVKATVIPGPNTKMTSPDGKISIWYQNGMIYAEWLPTTTQPEYFCAVNGQGNCDKTLKVLPLAVSPTSLEFYKGRSDVILVGVGDSVSAVELDTRGTQNFEPLYKGGTPSFVRNDNKNTLYVYDGTSLMEIAE